MWETLWEHLNDPVVIAAIASLVVYGLGRLYAAKPTWQRFEGSIIAAIKFAEKEIPDDTPNRPMRRLDYALRSVLQVYEAREGKATEKTKAELQEGIQILHADLEAHGTLENY